MRLSTRKATAISGQPDSVASSARNGTSCWPRNPAATSTNQFGTAADDDIAPNIYIRWAEFSAFCGLFLNGGHGERRAGAEDEDGLLKPLAYVVPNVGHPPGPALAREIMQFVKTQIAPVKYPRWVEFLDELPKSPSGKVLRHKLKPPRPHAR